MKPLKETQTKITVAIFGELLADIFPNQSVLGGAPYNVARHLQAFGLNAEIISRIGLDSLGEALMDEMLSLGLETQGIQFDAEYPTGQVKVHLQDNAHHFEIIPDQAYDHINMAITQETMRTMQPNIAYFGTLAMRGIESRLAAEQFLANANCLKFLDVNLRKPWFTEEIIVFALTQADIVKMNDDELTMIANIFHLSGSSEEQAFAIKERFNLSQILITCGEKGSWLINAQSQLVRSGRASTPIQVIDTVGAGDAHAAVFLLGTLYEWDHATTLERASQFASAMCGVRGAFAPSINFYQSFIQDWG